MKNKEYNLPDYSPNKETAFEARKRIERAKYRRNHRLIGEYDIFGELIQLYDYKNCPINIEAIKTNSLIENKYYKIYYGEDIIQQEIKVKKPVCKIGEFYFFSYSEIGRYLNVSRQAVSQAYNRKSKTISGKEIIWF
jgi:hypothetical protein